MYNDTVLINVLRRLMSGKEICSIANNESVQQKAVAILYIFQDMVPTKDQYTFLWTDSGISCPQFIENISKLVEKIRKKEFVLKKLKFNEKAESVLERLEDFFEEDSEGLEENELARHYVVKASYHYFNKNYMPHLKGDPIECFLGMASTYNKDDLNYINKK